MTEQDTKSRTLLIAGTTLALVVAIFAAAYVNRMERDEESRQVAEARLMIDKGMREFGQKQYQQSIETLSGISEDVLQDWHINYYQGSALIMLRDYESAALQLEKALVLNSADTNILYALGVAYYKLGKLGLSKAYFGQVLEFDPNHDDARGLMDIVANLERKQQADGTQP